MFMWNTTSSGPMPSRRERNRQWPGLVIRAGVAVAEFAVLGVFAVVVGFLLWRAERRGASKKERV